MLVFSCSLATGGAYADQKYNALNLPGVTLPSGHDEVRSADGTFCRSAVSGNGAYVDIGIIANDERDDVEQAVAGYGRIVIPLGAPKGRLDCRKLYNLELERLRAEVRLLQQGKGTVSSDNGISGDWANAGWSN